MFKWLTFSRKRAKYVVVKRPAYHTTIPTALVHRDPKCYPFVEIPGMTGWAAVMA
jgi:hypothetical protein